MTFGTVGFVWAFAWFYWFRDEPGDHPAVNAEELKHIRSGRGPDVPHHLDAAIAPAREFLFGETHDFLPERLAV